MADQYPQLSYPQARAVLAQNPAMANSPLYGNMGLIDPAASQLGVGSQGIAMTRPGSVPQGQMNGQQQGQYGAGLSDAQRQSTTLPQGTVQAAQTDQTKGTVPVQSQQQQTQSQVPPSTNFDRGYGIGNLVGATTGNSGYAALAGAGYDALYNMFLKKYMSTSGYE